jgi:hypothetical protein
MRLLLTINMRWNNGCKNYGPFLFIGQYENHCGDARYNANKSTLPLMWLHYQPAGIRILRALTRLSRGPHAIDSSESII